MLGHANINTTQIYAKVTNRKVGNDMAAFAGNVKMLDAKLQIAPMQEDVSVDDLIQLLKISTGRASDVFWEEVVAKVWQNTSNPARQSFVTELKNKESKPRTLRDFYVSLMDYFLENLKNENSSSDGSENTFAGMEMNYAVNF
jgi:hypothetical protein